MGWKFHIIQAHLASFIEKRKYLWVFLMNKPLSHKNINKTMKRFTTYNPRGNGQVEPFNGVIWKSVTLTLKSKNLPAENWEVVLKDALYSIRNLLCTAINATPHEWFFNFPRRYTNGQSTPTWLLEHGKVFVKKHFRSSKYDPKVKEADLIEAEPQYAHIKFPNGRESTVSIRDLAPGNSNPPHTNTENIDEKNIIHTERTSLLDKPLIKEKKSLLDTESNIDSPSAI